MKVTRKAAKYRYTFRFIGGETLNYHGNTLADALAKMKHHRPSLFKYEQVPQFRMVYRYINKKR